MSSSGGDCPCRLGEGGSEVRGEGRGGVGERVRCFGKIIKDGRRWDFDGWGRRSGEDGAGGGFFDLRVGVGRQGRDDREVVLPKKRKKIGKKNESTNVKKKR